MFTRVLRRLAKAKSRAYDAYLARYGELHPNDPRNNQVIVMGTDGIDWTRDDAVAEMLRLANQHPGQMVIAPAEDDERPYPGLYL